MVDVQIDKKIFDIDETPTIEKYNEVIQFAEKVISEVRENIYQTFLGIKSLKRMLSLMIISFLLTRITHFGDIRWICIVEFFVWFGVCIILSEYFTSEIKQYIQEELNHFKEKYKYIITQL